MSGVRPMLEYRAAADDRRRRDERVLHWSLRLLLAGAVLAMAYLFLLSLLGGIILLVAGVVDPSMKVILLAVGLLFASGVDFYLMMRAARVMDGQAAGPR